jgi:hypothetical protein
MRDSPGQNEATTEGDKVKAWTYDPFNTDEENVRLMTEALLFLLQHLGQERNTTKQLAWPSLPAYPHH